MAATAAFIAFGLAIVVANIGGDLRPRRDRVVGTSSCQSAAPAVAAVLVVAVIVGIPAVAGSSSRRVAAPPPCAAGLRALTTRVAAGVVLDRSIRPSATWVPHVNLDRFRGSSLGQNQVRSISLPSTNRARWSSDSRRKTAVTTGSSVLLAYR